MEQKYFVFTETKRLDFSSYQQDQDWKSWINKKPISEHFRRYLESTTDEIIPMPVSFEKFRMAFRNVVAAGGFVSCDRDLLMIFRNGKWDLPKGWMETGEYPMQTALREVREECGQLDLTILADLPLKTYHLYFSKGQYIFKETHWFRMKAGHNSVLFPQKKEGITKVEFVPVNSVDARLENSYPMIRWIWESLRATIEFIG
ncbi:MAG: NUDIX domain-containing protein [Bacteroidetes bacterium]|nr:NUDIX domain-containing protein [Bacteroidota bacterium]MBM3424203.1 NUDIX domain-containing protein [Bacteroidota bacterium]